MSSNMRSKAQSSTGSNKSRRRQRLAQTTADAKLYAAFEKSNTSGESFDYSQSIRAGMEGLSTSEVTAYLLRMQRGGLVQRFGCMVAVDEPTFKVIAYSDNTPEMFGLEIQAVPTAATDLYEHGGHGSLSIGTDARTLVLPSSAAALERAVGVADVCMFNPITVQSRNSRKPFYAILHRNDVGLVIDFEPITHTDQATIAGGALQSHKLAAKAISHLQSLPGGDIGLLCDTVVEEVRELTGFDRVMAYKFHEDEHGEVVAEIRRSDLEPYLGLHYPATDIPQAARFLFMKNRVRLIYDCRLPPVPVTQDKSLSQPLSLAGSTLRAPHGCHTQYMANMGSIASLVMAVLVNESDPDIHGRGHKTKLWGLVVCHHTGARYVPFPLRSACEFLMQVFSLQLNMEVELAAQVKEKHILQTQTLLCDMLLRDAPIGIVSESPNIMDLVKCDGAALYYGKKCWLLGVTPTESQIADIAEWLLHNHRDSTGLSTDSLAEAGYPGAASLGDAVCGLAAAMITSSDYLFWFRSHTAKQIKWGGAKHDPGDKDDGRRMHPRSSFQAFLEVVKRRSLPWDDVEMDAIHSLQLILRGSFRDIDDSDRKTLIHACMNELKLKGLDELSTVANEMVRLIETATVPILAIDSRGFINGWNGKVAELTGLRFEAAIGRSLAKEIAQADSVDTIERVLQLALEGEEEQDVEIHLRKYEDNQETGSVILIVNACCSRDVSNNVVGVCFIGQDVTRQKMVLDRFIRIQGDYKAIVQSPNPLIPPIFGADEYGFCSEWNPAMEKLSSWAREEVLGKMLVGEIFGLDMVCCRLNGQDAVTKLMIVLNDAMNDQECDKFPLIFHDRQERHVEALLIASKRTDADGRITGVFCFLHTASPELLQALVMQRAKEKVDKELHYLRQELGKPLQGIMFSTALLHNTNLSVTQRHLVETCAQCEKQLRLILDDDIANIEEGYLELETSEFVLRSVLDAALSQAMGASQEREIPVICEIPNNMKNLQLFGDPTRLQQALVSLLCASISHTDPPSGWVRLDLRTDRRKLDDQVHMMRLQFRISHPGPGLPEMLIQEMLDDAHPWTVEGLSLSTSRHLLRIMSADVKYILESENKRCFLVNVDLPLVYKEDAASVM